ncbi:hypothetical protein LNW72_12855 [Streptomyces sp. RKAG293]|nr:hypothetical protein [Streptomyces sp. RKAG293]
MVSLPGGTYLRMGGDAVRLLRTLDGTRTPDTVLADWSPMLGRPRAAETLTRFAAAGLLDTGGALSSAAPRRLVFRKPAMLQLTLYQPDRLNGVLRSAGAVLARRPVIVAYAALLCAGLVTTVANAGQLHDAIIHRSPGTWLQVYATMIAVNVLHEFGHATALSYFGGRPRRMGIMLLYFSPAFFCDVTSSWRLPRRRQRAAVALAGVAVNAAVAAVAALAGAADLGGRRQYWWLVVLANAMTITFNLLPFIKLDGYLLLLAAVDKPFVRHLAMADARSWLSHRVYRRPAQPRQLDRPWSVPYGFGALVLPPLLITSALLSVQRFLWMGGPVGAGIWYAAVLLALARLLYGAYTVAFPKIPAAARPGEPDAGTDAAERALPA